MKTCCMCKKEKLETEFYKNRKHKDGLQSRCIECKKSANHQYYLNDKDWYLKKTKLFKDKRAQEINLLKESVGCKFCSEKDGCCLDYHHVNGNKEMNVSFGCRHAAWSKVLKEITKCIVVCKNCHAKIHAGKLLI